MTNWIFNLKRFGDIKLRLKVVESLLEKIGNPHKKLKIIHVGGTNGKGSTVSMIASTLRASGYKVGMFTKPHLTDYTERITINGRKISEPRVVELIEYMIPYMKEVEKEYYHPTFFEVTAALMFKYFAEEKVDFAVIEVGLGGRLDATNVADSLVSVITNVGLEHTQILGDTIKKIAKEKSGIIKQNGVLLTASEEEDVIDVLRKSCENKNAKLLLVGNGSNASIKYEEISLSTSGQRFSVITPNGRYDDLHIPLLGKHQILNAALAVGAIESLNRYNIEISKESIARGLEKTTWPGRLEIMQKTPYVVLDCAKDTLATKKLVQSIKSIFEYKKLILVISITSGKRISEMLRDLAPLSDFIILTEHKVKGRAVDTSVMAKEIKLIHRPYKIVKDVKDAVNTALNIAEGEDLILVTGSVFTVGEAREIWHKEVNLRWGRELNESQ